MTERIYLPGPHAQHGRPVRVPQPHPTSADDRRPRKVTIVPHDDTIHPTGETGTAKLATESYADDRDVTIRGARIMADYLGPEYSTLLQLCEANASLSPRESQVIEARVLAQLLIGSDGISEYSRSRVIRLKRLVINGDLDLESTAIDRRLIFEDCAFELVTINDAELRSLHMPGCTVAGIDATNCRIDGNLELNHGFSAAGMVNLTGALITRDVRLTRSRWHWSPEDAPAVMNLPESQRDKKIALLLTRATINGALLASGVEVHGQVRAISTKVGGLVSLKGAKLENAGEIALQAERMEIGESLFFQAGFESNGRVFLQNATIKGGIDAIDSTFHGAAEGSSCLQLLRTNVGRNVSLKRASLERLVNLRDADIGGELILAGATFHGSGTEMRMRDLRAERVDLTWTSPPAVTDLRRARVGTLSDGSSNWSAVIRLRSFSFDALDEKSSPSASRLDWIARDPSEFTPHPYESLASYYHRSGDEPAAKKVLLEKERARRATLSPAGRAFGYVQDITVGYGYRNWQALIWIVGLVAAGTWVFNSHPPVPAKGAPRFYPVIYSLDLLVPVVDFTQTDKFSAAGRSQWFVVVLVLAGWLLTSAVIAGLTRSLSRE